MPSGSTHDRITLWSLPVVAGLTYLGTQNSHLTLLVGGSFLFSGLMFGPDLDIQSRQFQRWGWLRWMWLPYQKGLNHRSVWSHGFLVGTTLRVVYLTLWIGAIATLGVLLYWGYQELSWLVVHGHVRPWQDQPLLNQVSQTITDIAEYEWPQHRQDAIATFVGLEAGAMSHSLSDWIGSGLKALKKSKAKRCDRTSKK